MMMEVDEAVRFRTLRPPARHGIDAKKNWVGMVHPFSCADSRGEIGISPTNFDGCHNPFLRAQMVLDCGSGIAAWCVFFFFFFPSAPF